MTRKDTDETRPAGAGLAPARVAGLVIGVLFMGSTLLTPLYLIYQRMFAFSQVTLTLIYAVYVVGNLAALFFFGRLSDQIGRRRTSLPAIALAAIATLLFLCARDTAWLFVARILSGLATGVGAATATAWITELVPGEDNERASTLASVANFVGVAAGPLVAGLLAQFAPAPLATIWVLYLVLLGLVAWWITSINETVRRPIKRVREISFHARLGIPREIRKAFVPPAVATFATFALIGYYAALMPSLLSEGLGLTSPAIAGLIVAELFFVAAASVVLSRHWQSRTAMLAGLFLLLPSLGCLLLAQIFASLALLIIGTTLGGVASALGYRGSLQVVNGIAPHERRGEVISSYMIACYLGNSVPVIGVGVLSTLCGQAVAHEVFAATIAALAAIALVTEWRLGASQS